MSRKDLDITLHWIESVFREKEDPAKALEMSRYMKGLFAYLGIQKPDRDILEKEFLQECKKLPFSDIEYIAKKLWLKDEREFHYLAFQLLETSKLWKHNKSLELFEWLLVRKSWWDSVDSITTRLIGPYFLEFPENKLNKVKEWQKSNNMWLHRCTLLFQLKYKKQTDLGLLFGLIEYFSSSNEFFIQKAIGWALRQLSYTWPQEVVDFCGSHALKPLSQREALKMLNRKGRLNKRETR